MNFSFEATAACIFEHHRGTHTSTLKQTRFGLSVSSNIDSTKYLDENDLPTAAGSKCLTMVLVQALIGNIHAAHQKGFMPDHEHLKHIIEELQRGFVEIAEVGIGSWDEPIA